MSRFTRCDKCGLDILDDDSEIMFIKWIDGDYRDLCSGCNFAYNVISDESDEVTREWLTS